MNVHLIDGTYELFRHFYALPSARDAGGHEVAAVRGVIGSVFGMIRRGEATHIGVATDHVIESFRNKLWKGYKTSEGVPRELLAQFPLLEEALVAMGVAVWPMVEFEADDALASATRPTDIPACLAGARNPRRRCSRASGISSRFPRTGANGTSTRRTPRGLPERWPASAIARTSSARWRHSRTIFR
jgi:hypothetical protein